MRRISPIAGLPDLPRPYNLFGPTGRRNTKQKLAYLANRGVPLPLIELLKPFADDARGRDLLWFSAQLDRAMASLSNARQAPDMNALRAKQEEMLAAFPDLIDWLRTTRPNYSGMDWRTALQRSESWHQAMADNRPKNKRMKGREVVLSLPDKWAWVHVPKKEHLAEGKLMGHCFGRGSNPGPGGEGYSLRDPWNRPHVTLDVKWKDGEGWSLGQIKGKGNKTPIKVYAERVLELLATNPWGPSIKVPTSGGDLSRVLQTVYGDDLHKRNLALKMVAPAALIKTRARMTREVVAPDSMLAAMARRSPSSIPALYSHFTTKEMLAGMSKARSIAMVRGWARAAVDRMEELSRMGDRIGSAYWFNAEKWAQTLADDIGLPLPASATRETLTRMRRKSRSSRARDRRIAALVLPPSDLGAMIEDTDAAVRSILSLRLEGDDLLLRVLWNNARSEEAPHGGVGYLHTKGAPVPGWDSGFLVWRLSDKAFSKMHAEHGWHSFVQGVRKQIILRAAWQGLPLNISGADRDCDTYQLITQVAPLEKTKHYVEKFFRCWWGVDRDLDPDEDDPDEERAEYEGYDSLSQMIPSALRAKWLVAAPDLWNEMPDIAVLDEIPQWLYGRPARLSQAVMAAIGEHEEWWMMQEEMACASGDDVSELCLIMTTPLFVIARLAGLSDGKAWTWAAEVSGMNERESKLKKACLSESRKEWRLHRLSPPRMESIETINLETPWERKPSANRASPRRRIRPKR